MSGLPFSQRGEAKCVRELAALGASRLARTGVLDSALSTTSKSNEIMAVVSRDAAVR